MHWMAEDFANFSGQVASVGANAALGIYYVPKVDVTTYAFHSRGVTAGSMRGYGTMQTMTALEVLVDEICTALPLDPIEFRRRNALATGDRTMAGNPYIVSVRTPEILDKLERHPIWKERAEQKARGQQAGILVGTGVACATKNYGTGGDGTLGSVEIDPDGRITIHCDYVEMGTGIGTAVANRVAAHLGRVADEIALAQVDTFGPLALVTSGDSYTIRSEDAGRGGAQSALGACNQFSHHCLDRRPCRNTPGGRGRAHHLPLRSMAGGARIVGHRAERSQGQPMEDRRGGKTGNWSCRDWRHSPCRRSRQRRMRATA